MAKEYKDLVVGLDIGTSKVMVVVAEIMLTGELKLVGLGVAISNGLKRGVVVNIDATVQSIQQALKEAELMADCKITRVYTGITGSHIRGINSSGMVAVKDKEVTAADVARVIETAKAINISTDQRLLLVEPQEFVIDGQDVKEPIGMSGIRLEAKVHIVTGAQSAAENIIKCVRRCGLEVDQLMLNPLASSLSVLTEDEQELGVALVDIGAGTTDVAIFTNGAIRHTAVIPIAGDLITSDIAMALRTPTKDAEDIKVESGFAKQLLADPETQVEVPGLGDRGPRMLSRQALAGVIEPRGGPVEFSTDRYGGDYKNFELPPSDSGAACKAACDGDNKCRAWTYQRPGYFGANARCFLKSQVKPPRRRFYAISGVVR